MQGALVLEHWVILVLLKSFNLALGVSGRAAAGNREYLKGKKAQAAEEIEETVHMNPGSCHWIPERKPSSTKKQNFAQHFLPTLCFSLSRL